MSSLIRRIQRAPSRKNVTHIGAKLGVVNPKVKPKKHAARSQPKPPIPPAGV